MKKKKVLPTLTSVDLGLIRAMLITECAPLNREERTKIRKLEKQVDLLKRANELQRITLEAFAKSHISPDAPVFKFLLGEGRLGELPFDEVDPSHWRKHLREALGLKP